MSEFCKWKVILIPSLALLFSIGVRAQDLSDCPPQANPSPATDGLVQLTNDVIDISKAYGPYGKTPECAKDKTDPYDPAYKITYGDYAGQCIDSSTVRPPLVLSQDDKQITIANFYHEGKYWIAKIPKDAVSSVKFQGVPFDSALFGLIEIKHGQFRFKLNQPVILQEQAGSKSETRMIDDLIITSTATHPKGVDYSVFQGKNFGIATRALSSTSRGVEEISEDKSPVHQYELNLNSKQKSDFLVESIVRASDSGYRDLYQLLDHNCVTVAFDSLDATIERPKGVDALRGKWWLIRDEIEKPALNALKDRHIGYTQVQNMNDEMTCAKPGEALGNATVDASQLGAASALCRFNSTLPKPESAPDLF
jgi:hypothetical protein